MKDLPQPSDVQHSLLNDLHMIRYEPSQLQYETFKYLLPSPCFITLLYSGDTRWCIVSTQYQPFKEFSIGVVVGVYKYTLLLYMKGMEQDLTLRSTEYWYPFNLYLVPAGNAEVRFFLLILGNFIPRNLLYISKPIIFDFSLFWWYVNALIFWWCWKVRMR